MEEKSDILEYRAWMLHNRDVFLLNYPCFFFAFHQIDRNFGVFVELLGRHRDKHGKAHVSLVPFVLLMQRQSRAAFEALCTYQAYAAWVLVRPCIEAVLIAGKWIDDARNAAIWLRRSQDPKSYRETYSGKKLRSASLP